MQDSSKGKMFLSGERGHTETDWFRSYTTFNFGGYRHPDKIPFGALQALNDDTLAAGRKMNFLIEIDTVIILLPVVGAVHYNRNGNTGIVKAGEAVHLPITAGDYIEFSNPFETELVNYLHLWFTTAFTSGPEPQIISFDVDVPNNQLVSIDPIQAVASPGFINSYIGKFNGREEAIFPISESGKGVFVFVLEGAFEVQYRLLEARDGLALWNIQAVEMEALSANAILLLVELSITDTINLQ